jgi:hypothetical protein
MALPAAGLPGHARAWVAPALLVALARPARLADCFEPVATVAALSMALVRRRAAMGDPRPSVRGWGSRRSA